MTDLPPLEAWQWAALVCAAFCTGLSKTGVAGVGVVSVALFPLLLPPRFAVGGVLILLVSADMVAVASYRREAEWKYLWRLLPWTALGVFAGYFAAGHIADGPLKHLIGVILFFMGAFQLVQRVLAGRKAAAPSASGEDASTPAAAVTSAPPLYLSALIGILAGFTTMVANAAGPIMVLYLLSMRLPKTAFIGTTAWFFMVLNVFKLPFSYMLGGINLHTFRFAATLFPAAFAGGIAGRLLLKRIPQTAFEIIALVLTLVAGAKLAWPW